MTDYLAVSDIADLAGVSSNAVSNWIARHPDFPTPHHVVARGEIKVWRREDVHGWLLAHGKVRLGAIA